MFSSTFILLAALAKVALALNAGDLAVSLQAVHSTVDSAQDIIVTAVISNPTDKEVKVLAVNNVLDNSATKSFEIIADGKEVTFAGVEVRLLSFDALFCFTEPYLGGLRPYSRPSLCDYPRWPVRCSQSHHRVLRLLCLRPWHHIHHIFSQELLPGPQR